MALAQEDRQGEAEEGEEVSEHFFNRPMLYYQSMVPVQSVQEHHWASSPCSVSLMLLPFM